MKNLALAILALAFGGCISAERVTFLTVPTATETGSVDVAALEKKYGKHDGVYLIYADNLEHVVTKQLLLPNATSSSFYRIVRRKYVVFNPEAEWLSTFSLNVGKSAKIGTFYLQVTSPGGPMKTYGVKDLVKETDSEGILHYKFIYPNVVRGTIIDEGFDIDFGAVMPPLRHELPMQFTIPCDSLSVRFAYPDWWDIQVKRIAASDTGRCPVIADPEHHKKILAATARNVPAVESEPYAPYFKENSRYLEFMITKFELGRWYYNAPPTWDEHASRFKPFVLNRETMFSSTVQRKTDEVTRGISDERAKVDSILGFLQGTIAVADDGKERDFGDVLDDRKGSEYEITGLAHSMLKKSGFSPMFLLVHSAEEGYFDSTYHSRDQLPVPAVDVRAGGQHYLIFPYRKDIALDQIPQDLQGQPALVISEEPGAPLITVRSSTASRNAVEDAYDVTLTPEGTVEVKEEMSIRGTYALQLRKRIARMNAEKREKFLKMMAAFTEGAVTVRSTGLENETNYKEPLVMKAEYTIDNILTVAPDEVIFQTGGLFVPSSLKDAKIEAEERKNPISIDYDEEFTKKITLHYPPSWEITSGLPEVQVENTFGSLKAGCAKGPGVLTVTQYRILKRSSAPKEEIARLVDLVGSKSKAALPTLVFGKK